MAVRWIEYCSRYHKTTCTNEGPQPSGMKLIDCTTLSIVHAPPSASYAALSYVWGRNPLSNYTKDGKIIQDSLPRVIQDGILVTKELGLHFLWVDKLCIDQDDAQMKHMLISQMDDVYSFAVVTIIATAGDDENHGLPGVGTTLRKPQPVVQLEGIKLLSTMPHPHHTIFTSRWATRGWTYQEAVLSRRRLVFTEEQIYFECGAMSCTESVENSNDLIVEKHGRLAQRGLFSGTAPDNHVRSWNTYLHHVKQYTKRNLSYEDDSLKAFTGIIKHFSVKRDPVLQLCGMPFWGHDSSGNKKDVQDIGRGLVLGLLWKCLSRSLQVEKPHRRSGFPSWTWAGWSGAADYSFINLDNSSVTKLFPVVEDMRLEYGEGEELYLKDFDHSFGDVAHSHFSNPKALHLYGWVVSLKRVQQGSTGYSSNPDHIEFWNVAGQPTQAYLSHGPESLDSISELFRTRKWELILVAALVGGGLYFLIIENQGHSAARVGLLRTEYGRWEEFRKEVHAEPRTVRLI